MCVIILMVLRFTGANFCGLLRKAELQHQKCSHNFVIFMCLSEFRNFTSKNIYLIAKFEMFCHTAILILRSFVEILIFALFLTKQIEFKRRNSFKAEGKKEKEKEDLSKLIQISRSCAYLPPSQYSIFIDSNSIIFPTLVIRTARSQRH